MIVKITIAIIITIIWFVISKILFNYMWLIWSKNQSKSEIGERK